MNLTVKLLTLWADQKRLELHTSRCLHRRNKSSSCTKCVDVCSSPSALELTNQPQLFTDHCLDCMHCTRVCPTQVFQDKQWKEQLLSIPNRETVIFACERQGDKEYHVVLPCIFQIELVHLGWAGQYSNQLNVYFHEEQCKNCPLYREEMMEKVSDILSSAEKIFSKCGKEIKITLLNEWVEKREQTQRLSRRDFFALLSRKALTRTVDPFLPFFAETKYSKEKVPVSEERNLLLHLLRKITQNADKNFLVPSKILKTAKVTISDACSGCGVCVAFCPTGSLQMERQEGSITLNENLSHCVDCGLCKEFCPEQAIEYETSISIAEFCLNESISIYERKRNACNQCGAFTSLESFCEDCSRKKRQETDLLQFFS